MSILTGALIVLLVVVVVTYMRNIRKGYDFFARLGIPGPPPTLFFGNFLSIIRTRVPSIVLQQWTNTYGPVFGYFEGRTPILVISEPDVVQDIFVKSFSKFHSRRESLVNDPKAKDCSLFNAVGLRWKRQRFVINPAFSSVKLKQMLPLINRSVKILMEKLAEQCSRDEPFDVYAYYKRFTMDTIWSCGFGLDTDMQNNADDPYLLNSQQIFAPNKIRRVVFILLVLVSELRKIFRILSLSIGKIRYWLRRSIPITKQLVDERPGTWIVKQAYEMIEKRIDIGHTQRTDLLQLMLDSSSNEEFIQVTWFFFRDTKMLLYEMPISILLGLSSTCGEK